MYLLAIFLGSTTIGACGGVLYLVYRNRTLAKLLVTKRSEIEESSKMLIGKNLELNDQNLKQQKLLESREDFIAIVSHQLRTPATEMRWGIGEIRNNPDWQLTIDERVFIERLYISSEWMVNLIDRLVKLVNFEHGSGSTLISPYAPDEAIKASAEQIPILFPGKKIDLVFDLKYEGVLLSIDPDSLKMIVSNLVDNSFHYTPNGGTVKVGSEAGVKDELVVKVSDTGMGIPKEKQKTMFVKFQRGEGAVVANEKGMGLGLYVVKKIVEQRGGTIRFETEEGKGSTFFVTLPKS